MFNPVLFFYPGGRTRYCCSKPIQPERIVSGLKEVFIKKYIAERTNKAEIGPEVPSEKAESGRIFH